MMTLNSILVATDFGEASETALNYGRELARRFGATLHVLHVVDDVAARIDLASGVAADIGHLQAELENTARRDLEALVSDEDRRLLNAQPSRARPLRDGWHRRCRAPSASAGRRGQGRAAS